MAADLAPRVRVNAVLPGAVETASLKRYLDARTRPARRDGRATPMRRNGLPEDIASAVLYFAARRRSG